MVIASGEPWRLSAFFLNLNAASLSRSFVPRLSKISPSWSTARHRKRISPFTFTYISSRCQRQ